MWRGKKAHSKDKLKGSKLTIFVICCFWAFLAFYFYIEKHRISSLFGHFQLKNFLEEVSEASECFVFEINTCLFEGK